MTDTEPSPSAVAQTAKTEPAPFSPGSARGLYIFALKVYLQSPESVKERIMAMLPDGWVGRQLTFRPDLVKHLIDVVDRSRS